MHLEKINCLAVDDEPPALEVLKKYIANVPSLELATTCADALEAMTPAMEWIDQARGGKDAP